MSLPQFRPRSPTEIVDAAIQLGRRHYKSLLVLSAIIAIPNLVLGIVAQSLLPPDVSTGGGDTAEMALYLENFMLAFGASAISLAWTVVGFGALVASTAAAYVDGRTLEPLDAMKRALRRSVRLVLGNLIAYVLVTLAILVGLFLLMMVVGAAAVALGGGAAAGAGGDAEALGALIATIIGVAAVVAMLAGGLLLGARYVNITASVMLEDRGISSAIRRSTELVRGNVWRTAGVMLIMFVLYMVAFLTSWAVFLMVVRDVNLSANVAGVLVLALYPFLGAMLMLLYYDLRIRREGYDLELMARALGPTEGIGTGGIGTGGGAPGGGAPGGGAPGGGAPGGGAPAAGAQA